MAEERPTPMLPSSPGVEADFRSATEAMQRAADAMIAATESFRSQFQQQQGLSPRPFTYHAPPEADEGRSSPSIPRVSADSPRESDSKPASFQLPFLNSGSTALGTPRDTASIDSRPHTGKSSLATSSPTCQSSTPVPAAPPLEDFFPARPPMAARRSFTSSFGAHVVTGASDNISPGVISMTPTTEWPITTGSAPNLAMTLAPAPIVPTGPGYTRRASTQHVDLLEAVERYKSTRKPASTYHQPSPSNGLHVGAGGAPEEPSPVVQIGRYTYVRTDTDDFRSSLVPLSNDVPPGPGAKSIHPPVDRPHGFSLIHEILFVLVISLAQMLMLSGISQALIPQFIIGESFPGTTPGDRAWYSAAYGLTAGTFVLPSGRLGDLFGHKKIFIIGFLWFGAWELIGGFSLCIRDAGGQGTVYFIFCRAMQGIGPALLVPNGQAMLGRAYKPGPRKNLVMSLFGASAPFGFVAGGAMASLFAIKASWPWAFWTMSAMCICLAAVSAAVLPSTEQTRRKEGESIWLQLDIAGIAFGVAGLVLFNFAFNQAPIVSWSTPYTYFILIIGIMLLTAFVYTELVTTHPLVPIAAMRSTTNFILGCTAAGWGCFSIWVYYSFSFMEVLRGWSPLLSAAGHSHGPVAGLIASLLTAYLMGKIMPHWIMFASMCAFFTGSLLFATAPVEQSYWLNSFFSILVMPFGMDMSNPAATILLSNSVSKEHQGIAASLVVTVVNYSISIALGIAGTVESHTNKDGTDILAGYRGAQYFGLGLGGLGILLAAAFLLQAYRRGTPPSMPGPSKVG